MSTGDVLAIVAATIVTMIVVVLAIVLVLLTRTLRSLRATPPVLEEDCLELLDDVRRSVADAAGEIDRVERLVTSAQRLDETKRAIATPVVKAMAFGTGVSRRAAVARRRAPARVEAGAPEIGIVIKRLGG